MQKNDEIWKFLKDDSNQRDLRTKERIIQATKDRKAYSQFGTQMKLRSDWGKKYEINREQITDWRATFKFLVNEQRFNECGGLEQEAIQSNSPDSKTSSPIRATVSRHSPNQVKRELVSSINVIKSEYGKIERQQI